MLMGRVTRDPESRYTPAGTAILDLSLAVNRKIKSVEETKEEVTFVDITFYGKAAEVLTKYVTKGKPLYIEGRLHLDSWEDKQTGQKKTRLKIIGEEFEFLGDNRNANNESTQRHVPPASAPPQPYRQPARQSVPPESHVPDPAPPHQPWKPSRQSATADDDKEFRF